MEDRIERAKSIILQGSSLGTLILFIGILVGILFSILIYQISDENILAVFLGGVGAFSGYYILYLITSTFTSILDQITLTNERLIELEKSLKDIEKNQKLNTRNEKTINYNTDSSVNFEDENAKKERKYEEGKIVEIEVKIIQIFTNTTYEALLSDESPILIETNESLIPFIQKKITITGIFMGEREVKIRNYPNNSLQVFYMKTINN